MNKNVVAIAITSVILIIAAMIGLKKTESSEKALGEEQIAATTPKVPEAVPLPDEDDDDEVEPVATEAKTSKPLSNAPKATAKAESFGDAIAKTSPPADFLEKNAPSPEEMGKEVAADPHSTPRALMNFATAMSPEMEKADASPAYAEKLFPMLEACALGKSEVKAIAAQALCLSNMRSLARKYPALDARAQAARTQASEKVRNLSDKME